MQGTNVLFGQIAVVFGIVIAGVWAGVHLISVSKVTVRIASNGADLAA